MIPLTCYDHSWPKQESILLESVIINETSLRVHLVWHGLKEDGSSRHLLAGRVKAVGKMAAVRQVQT